MFDIGFSELILIAVVALLVIGPERLPAAARVAGLWVGRIKRGVSSIKEDVARELGADDIRRELHNEGILEKERQILKETSDKANKILSEQPLQTLFEDTSKPKDSTPVDKEQSP
ncbi:Sec-independent protein translocase protein TatB [Denitrificimonas caeni]|uniref:Sec-independent protein translocase protein TatB n=1 Tax=Denitrificimonas caeni TaxID=521720 RepID=A0AAE9VNF5_9GAMM|nr:Sec-independent protein translocase protein TatB [Denitrificimonas caeni]NLJ11725.1 twin-arginine translocase subunit TatB [Gammaproteobacteria bacterium]WBE25380.1 Sec-independent protein translocase protein TatB [Denitrificimonas caeni]